MFMKNDWLQVTVRPCPGAKNMYIIVNSNIFSETAWPIKVKLTMKDP